MAVPSLHYSVWASRRGIASPEHACIAEADLSGQLSESLVPATISQLGDEDDQLNLVQ
ncbi:hypothetical protein BN2476_650086 [Paraburkholderia piptadeniae]|uniref:Uncharacterized protein n=1 Tax=Paraburkholderia piptadeniae TaxID=1701573 RepID=A0A1N7SNA0_9BURK|nr:hypothetical protein BN2476_650086 [Paraburkholderia piptadeniae]